MKFFPLLINGSFEDTGRYRYLPYADLAICDPVSSMKAQREAQKGLDTEDVRKFIYAKYCICNEEAIRKAIRTASSAASLFRHYSFSKRVRIFSDIHELLVEKKRPLIDLMIIEGHPAKLAEWEYSGMELAYRPESIKYFKSQLRGMLSHNMNEQVGWVRKADGVVCVCPPGNASCSNSLTAGFALLGGNALIVKPPLRMPIATLFLWHEIVWEALKRNDAPIGIVNTIVGNSNTIMNEWLASPLVNDILFFGKSEDGMKIGVRAFECGKKPILELSGNDMLFVWKDASIDRAVDSLTDAFLGSTQICMVPKKAVIHDEVFDHFSASFVKKASNMKIGLPSDTDVCLTPVARIDDFNVFLSDALDKGADLLCGGQRVNHLGEPDPKGGFVQPTVLSVQDLNKALTMRCVLEENFFPLIPLIRISGSSTDGNRKRDDEIFSGMIKLANGNNYGLRASVWASSNYYIGRFIRELDRSGLLRINMRHTGFSSYLSTHGGTGLSGGPYGEMNYIWQKTTHLQGVSVSKVEPDEVV